MTVVAGLVHGGRVYMGADSAAFSDHDLTVRKDPKVFRHGPYLLGFCGSFRVGQVLRFRFTIPEPPARGLERFMVGEFVDAFRSALTAASVSTAEDLNAEVLVGVRGRLFHVESDFQVGEAVARYDAIGCGAPYALGSLASTSGAAERRVLVSLRASQAHCTGVRAPFRVLHG